jgi:hypothetical protein
VNDIIVTNKPTKRLLAKVHKERKIIITFMHQPEAVTDVETSNAFLVGWLTGLGLKPDYRLALVMIPRQLDLEEYKNEYLKKLENSVMCFPIFANTITATGTMIYDTPFTIGDFKNERG